MEIRTISNDMARRFAIAKQGLQKRPPSSDQATLYDIIRNIGLLQLDSISVTARSHYLVMLSRAGIYDRAELDALLSEGRLFEQWAHAACLIPMEDFPYFEPIVRARRGTYERYYERLGDDPEGVLQFVMDEVRENGPVSSKHFETERKHKGTWWNWKPTKVALEILFNEGRLMTSHRENFHRYYDLPERVLDGIEFADQKTSDAFLKWSTIAALRYQGVATTDHIADYYRQKKRDVQAVIDGLVEAGSVVPVEVDSWRNPAYVHADDQSTLDALETTDEESQLTIFLSPFDNLIWHRDRTEEMFDFYYRIEVYTPANKRQYGYYVLPILHRGRLVGRIDPKIERKKKQFLMRALHLEDDTEVTDDLVTGLVGAIREFMIFHHCEHFVLERCAHAGLKKAILKAVL